MLLQELIRRIPGLAIEVDPQVRIHGISYDSRRVAAGDLFIAIKGEKTDGALYVQDAVARGAVAVAVDRDIVLEHALPVLVVPDAQKFLAEASCALFSDPASRMQLVGITGTNGKTTTSYLVDAIFRQAGLRSCTVGTIEMRIGDQPFRSMHTTPEASDLTAFLDQALRAGCTHGALEVSSHALVLKRVYGTHFSVGVFCNLTPEHLDFHHDMESYYEAKRLLFTEEGANSIQFAVINADDTYGQRLMSEVPITTVSYGFATNADVRVLDSRSRMEGTSLHLASPHGELHIETRLVGRPNVYNIMAAAGATLSLGISPQHIREGIESLSGVPGRLEPVCCGQDFTVIVDYAHTPDALEKLLLTVRQLTHGRTITVFGCGGDRDRKKRTVMGAIAARLSDFVVATSDNPRSEDPLRILAEIEPGLKQGRAPYRLLPDRREAIRTALAMARTDDVVLLAGKGHENYQWIGTQSFSFDDRVVAQELIHEMQNAQGDRACGKLHQ